MQYIVLQRVLPKLYIVEEVALVPPSGLAAHIIIE